MPRMLYRKTFQGIDPTETHGQDIAAEHFRTLLVAFV